MRSLAPLALVVALGLAPLSAPAQEVPNLMIVFDASGSMWGRIDGRPKIELAREALSSVLSEADPSLQIGMIAYGHRVRGQCSDIELAVPMGQAALTVPQMLAFANRVNPRGMTPLTDSVLMAAQGMGYTEQSATVVLVTDGIETCAGDPCALGRLLASQGIDFRAHVVGFDLTDAEQQQVACLAEETGGLFLAANDADELRDALARTLTPAAAPAPAPEPEPEPVATPRRVDLILRDVQGGPVLTGRPFRTVELQPMDPGAPPVGSLDLALNAPATRTGRIELLPGRYTLRLVRETQGREVIRVALPVEIPEGTDPYTVDLVIAARLQVNALLHEGQPMPERNGRIPRLTGQGWAEFAIHPVVEGAIDPAVNYGGINSQDVALPPGDYLIRGTLTQTFTRERLVSVAPGVTTTVDFDFAAAPVAVDLRDAQGFPVDRVRVEIFDLDAAEPFVSGRGRDRTDIVPAFLPEGTWRITAREDRGGSRPAEAWVTVTPGVPVTLSLTPGMTADPGAIPETALPLCLDTHAAHGCVVESVTPAQVAAFQGLPLPPPRFTGTWQTQGGMMALVQDGRRVWGEVHVNGGVGTVWGHVAPDGLTLRGAMDASSNPRGTTEMHLAADGQTLQGVWDHNIGRMRSDLRARRLSAGVPPLTVATGTEDDLRVTMNGAPWAPADSPEFAAFLEPALAPASPDTGDDIDAMQAAAAPPSFSGTWDSDHQTLTLVQDGRRVIGRRERGPILGEVSADGQVMRGVWINLPRDWGLLEFRLNPARTAFEGAWGRLRDGGASQRWNGRRISWLSPPVDPADYPAEATGELWEAFMAPVRDPDPVPALPDRAEAAPAIGAIVPLPEDGIFAAMADRPGEAIADAFARLFDGSQDARMAEACAETPWVLHPDGLMAERQLDLGAAETGRAAFFTTRYQRCEQAGPLVTCRVFQSPLGRTEGEPMFDYTAEVIAGPDGSFALRDADTGRAMLYRECRGARGFLAELDRLPDGRLVVEQMFTREDQAAAASGAGPDYAASAGLYGQAGMGCDDQVFHLTAEGQLDAWRNLLTRPQTAPATRLVCDPAGLCRIDGSAADPVARVQTLGDRLRLCTGAGEGCANEMVAELCPADQPDPAQRALILGTGTPTPAPATATGAPLTIPPGLWTAEAPWSDPMPPAGTPAFAERCFDDISATFPDGLTLGFQLQDTAAGPDWQVTWSETCAPSGDATWPLACTSEDGSVADPAAATIANRLRVLSATAERVEMDLLSAGEPQPDRIVLHACLRPDGRGIDLAGDPRGRALARALAGVRNDGGPGLDLTAVPGGAAAAPAKPPRPVAVDPRPGLAGLWTRVPTGRSAADLTGDDLATQCFEQPGRLHADGLFVAFSLRDGVPQPEAHLRCDASLSCAYAEGSPSAGRPVQGQARLNVVTEAEIEACLGDDCLTLARCPAPEWTARERAGGLASRWETAVEQRD